MAAIHTVGLERWWNMDRTIAQPSRRGTAFTHLFADWARPVRFVIVGGICGMVQLALLGLFIRSGAPAIPANVAAFLLSAQVNFALSSFFTWHDRTDATATGGLVRRWLRFHGSIAGGALVNQVVFLIARSAAPDLAAAALGIGAAAIANFLLQDRFVFRRRTPAPAAARPVFEAGTANERRPVFSIVNGAALDDVITLRRSRPRPDRAEL